MVAPMKRGARGGAAGSSRAADRNADRVATRGWFTARSVAKATGGSVVQGGPTGKNVTTDTREDCTGLVFVALRGDNHDGHAYLEKAVAQGAVGLVVDREVDLAPILRAQRLVGGREPFVVQVADTSAALLDLAAEHRRRHHAKVVGITGSCGKTSTKEWLGGVLEASMPAVRSPGSYNNQVGVPLTLFLLQPDTRAAVVEIGTNAPGEIEQLSKVARPDIGIVTCVAPAHLEGLGSVDGVAREKSELPRSLPADGVCILNGDDAACRAMADVTEAKVEFISVHREADWFATNVRFCALGTSFLLQGKRPVTLPRLGTHNVYNALAVIAAAHHLGVPEDLVLQQLACVPSAARRLEPKVVAGVTIFDDTYNMNPESARSALQAVAGLRSAVGGGGTEGAQPAAGGRAARGIVVFGSMLELGSDSLRLHEELGAQVVASGHDRLVCVGQEAEPIAAGAIAAGMAADRVSCVDDIGAAHALLIGELRAGDRLLCKASRRIALDRLVDRLVQELGSVEPADAQSGDPPLDPSAIEVTGG